MKSKVVILIALLTMIAASVYAAPDRTGKWDAGINISGAIQTDSDLDSTVYAGGTLAYGVNEWLAVGIESGWMKSGSELNLGGGVKLDAGDLTGVPLLGDVILRAPIKDSSVNPYGIVGLGAIFWNFDESALFKAAGVQVDIDTSLAVKLGGGLDWFVNDHWILNFEAAYVFVDADVTAKAGGITATDTTSADYWTIGGGLKYLF